VSTENLGSALFFFVSCWKKKKLISSKKEFECIIPFCVMSIEKNPNNVIICHNGLFLVQQGLVAGIPKRYLEESGIHKAVGAVLQDPNAKESVKQRARGLMKSIS
jgi:hypothetical protein